MDLKQLQEKHKGDFDIMYDKTLKRHYWVLGYFGGGAINISKAMVVAKDYADVNGVDINTVMIDEVLSSRRYKHFKVVYSTEEQELNKNAKGYSLSTNVWGDLTQ